MTQRDRTEDMISRYGEAVTITGAGRILNRDRTTIYRMLEDGRLDTACAGTMVDVRSIARYICAPATYCRKVRMRKIMERSGQWAV